MVQELTEPTHGIMVAVGGWIVAILVAMFTAIIQLRKGGAEETAVVLGKWKELVEAHENQILGLKQEIEALRKRVRELEELAECQKQTINRLERELKTERRKRERDQ